jgi:lysophospholipase L1-like esterase
MDWHTVKHAAVAYVTEYRNLKPDVVVIFHGINDLYRSFTPSKYALGTYREDYSHFYGSAINGANPPSFEKYLYTTFFENLGENYFINRSPMYFEISKFVSLASYEKYITNLTDILIRDSIKVCLLSQPSLYKDVMSNAEAEKLWLGKSFCSEQTGVFSHQYADVQSLKYALDSLNRITAKVANNYHVDFFDLAAAIPKNSSFFIDDVHFTPEANQLIAEKLFIHLSTKQQ